MQGLCVLASARQPGGNGGLTVAEDALSGRRIQSFGERRQHRCDLTGGSFQTVQGGVASGVWITDLITSLFMPHRNLTSKQYFN